MAEAGSQITSIEDVGGLQAAAPQPVFNPPPTQPVLPIPARETGETSHWPRTIALIAAATGSFGPLVQYLDQKRRTSVYNQAAGLLQKTYAQMNKGQTQEAIEQFQVGMSQLGARASELSQFMQPFISQMSNIQQNQRDKESLVQMLGAQATAMELEKNPAMAKIFKNVAKVLKDTNVPMDSKFMQDFVNRHTQGAVHLLPGENAVVRSFPTGEDIVSPLETTVRREDISDYQAGALAKEWGITVPGAINVLRSKDPALADQQKALNLTLTNAKGEEQDMAIAAKTPLAPEYNAAARFVMTANYGEGEGLRRASQGKFSTEENKQIIQMTEQLMYNRAAASVRAQMQEDIFAANKAGLTVYNKRTLLPTVASARELEQNPQLGALPNDVIYGTVLPASQALAQLYYIDQMFEQFDDANRLERGMARWIADKTGVSIGPEVTTGKAAELIADRAIEEVGRIMKFNQDSQVMKQLKGLVLGKFANKEEAKIARTILYGALKEKIDTYTGPRDVPTPEAVDKLDKAKRPGTGSTQAPPGQPGTPTAPTAPTASLPPNAVGTTPGGAVKIRRTP